MKIDTLNVRPAKTSVTPAVSGAATARLNASPSRTAAKKASASPAAGGEERRRGQRVLLRIPASIHVALQGKTMTFDVTTLSVNPCGALVVMQNRLPPETRLVLEHKGTKERIACKVARAPREMREGFHVPLEFDSPAPDFWKIAFPPADWRPDDL